MGYGTLTAEIAGWANCAISECDGIDCTNLNVIVEPDFDRRIITGTPQHYVCVYKIDLMTSYCFPTHPFWDYYITYWTLTVTVSCYPFQTPNTYNVSAAISYDVYLQQDYMSQPVLQFSGGVGYSNQGTKTCGTPQVLTLNDPPSSSCPGVCSGSLCDPCGSTITISFE